MFNGVKLIVNTLIVSLLVALSSSLITGVFLYRWLVRKASRKEKEICSLEILSLKSIESSKNAFISMISHELRTPLTSIVGALKMLEKVDAISQEDAKNLLVLANRNADKLMHIINDIVDVQKLQLGKFPLNIRPVLLIKPLEEAIRDTTQLAIEKKITILLEGLLPDLFVHVDYERLEQIFMRLLVNAIKFSNPEKQIVVFMEIRCENVRVGIKDNGVGIPFDLQDKIFGRFSQIEGSDIRLAGTGLSLNICKGIVEKMGGLMGFESNVGTGSIFYIEFPIYKGEM